MPQLSLSLSLQEGDLEVMLNMGTKTDPDVEEECKTSCAITDWSILGFFCGFPFIAFRRQSYTERLTIVH